MSQLSVLMVAKMLHRRPEGWDGVSAPSTGGASLCVAPILCDSWYFQIFFYRARKLFSFGNPTPIKEVSNVLSLHPFQLENRCVCLFCCHCDPVSTKEQLSLPWKREDMGMERTAGTPPLGLHPTSHLGETAGREWIGVGLAINPQSLPPESDFLQRDSTS